MREGFRARARVLDPGRFSGGPCAPSIGIRPRLMGHVPRHLVGGGFDPARGAVDAARDLPARSPVRASMRSSRDPMGARSITRAFRPHEAMHPTQHTGYIALYSCNAALDESFSPPGGWRRDVPEFVHRAHLPLSRATYATRAKACGASWRPRTEQADPRKDCRAAQDRRIRDGVTAIEGWRRLLLFTQRARPTSYAHDGDRGLTSFARDRPRRDAVLRDALGRPPSTLHGRRRRGPAERRPSLFGARARQFVRLFDNAISQLVAAPRVPAHRRLPGWDRAARHPPGDVKASVATRPAGEPPWTSPRLTVALTRRATMARHPVTLCLQRARR